MNQQKVKLPGFSLGYVIYDIVMCSIFLLITICGFAMLMIFQDNAEFRRELGQDINAFLYILLFAGVLNFLTALIADIMILAKKRIGVTIAYVSFVITAIHIILSLLDALVLKDSGNNIEQVGHTIGASIGVFLRVAHLVIYIIAVKKASSVLKPQQFGFN